MLSDRFVQKFRYKARNMLSRPLFAALRRYTQGHVLDVGGRDFYPEARRQNIPCWTWTNLETGSPGTPAVSDEKYRLVFGDGTHMPFADGQFDTVLNIQVLEHVFEPLAMVREISRVLAPGGHGIFLIPQTGVIHETVHYYNFTRCWITEAMARNGLDIIELIPLGGRWTSSASHFLHFFFQAFRVRGFSFPECKRNVWFYILFPVMAVYAFASIMICLVLSAGDLTEEPNNHLVVVSKNWTGGLPAMAEKPGTCSWGERDESKGI